MTPETATEIIKEQFDIGDCKFYFSSIYGESCLSIDLPNRTLHIDKHLCQTTDSLLKYFESMKDRPITFSHREV